VTVMATSQRGHRFMSLPILAAICGGSDGVEGRPTASVKWFKGADPPAGSCSTPGPTNGSPATSRASLL